MAKKRQHKIFRPRRAFKSWFIIVLIAVLAHIAFIILFKTDYLKVFERNDIGITGSRTGSQEKDSGYGGFSLIYIRNDENFKEPSEPVVKIKQETPSERFDFTLDIPPVELPKIRGIYGEDKGGKQSAGSGGSIKPKPLFIPWPEYPEGVDSKYHGQVKLKLFVNENGDVEEIEIVEGLSSEILNRKAIEAASRIRFSPGRINGQIAAMWVQISIGFQPR